MTTTSSDRRSATLDLPGLDDTLQPFGQSRMLPAAAYTSEDVFAWEMRHLYAGTYTCVGREDELRAPDTEGRPLTQRAVMVGDVHVLLTWSGEAGSEIQAFANTCRHRAHELLDPRADDGKSSKQSIVCPYHAWTYDLNGSLRSAPGYKDVPGFQTSEHGLVALPVYRWHGWLFVHAATSLAAEEALPFDDHIGDLEGLVAPYAPESLVLGDRHSYVVEANWKVIAENYHECYHCPLIHPELCQVTPPSSGDNLDLPGAWLGGTMDLRDGMQTMSLTGESGGRPIPGVSSTSVLYAGMVPNLLISAHPDYVMAHRFVPLSAGRTWVECSWYFPDTSPEEPIDPAYAVEFWDITNKQDWSACESVQRGLASPHVLPGPFSPSEDAVHMFVTTIARAYRGLPIHEPTGTL
jgi:glycine betaine catabolism A